MGAYRLKIDLLELNPPCSRTILVPDSFCFRNLAKAIDAAFEWWEGHAYLFEVYDNGEKVTEITDYGDEIGMPKWEDEDVPVSKYIDKPLTYVYDFGDYWIHQITLEGKAEDYDRSYPTLEAFEGRSPPEDCGGTDGYEHLLEVLADLKDPEHKGLGAWAESLGFRDPVPEDICAEMCGISEDDDSRGVWMAGDTELGPYVLPGDSFWDDVDKYRGTDPGPARRIRCDDPFPTYKALNPKQLKWYLSWRAACERGEIVQTDSGYVWLYLAELTDREDWRSAIGQMDALMEAFRGTDAYWLVDSTRWHLKTAHEVLGDLRDPSPCFNWQEAARYFSESPLPEPPAAAVRCTIEMYKNYCEGREDEVAELIGYSMSAMDAYCRSVHGKDVINTLYETKWVTHYGWLPSRRPRTFFENTCGDLALMSISICAVSRMWRMDHPRGGPQVRPPLDKEFVNLIDMAVKDCAAGKPFDPDRYSKPVKKQ